MNDELDKIVLEKLKKIEEGLITTKPFLNIEEVSTFTEISKSTIYKLTSTRQIPYYKKAKNLVFDRIEIEKWLKLDKIVSIEEIDKESDNFFF